MTQELRIMMEDDGLIDEPEYVKCPTCGLEAMVIGYDSFNDCPNEGGEEYGRTISFVKLECGHRIYDI
jgi:hypothetical protein